MCFRIGLIALSLVVLTLITAVPMPGAKATNEPPRNDVPSCWQSVPGNIGASSQWESGWLDLAKTTTFHQGDKLRLKVGGAAKSVLVRLLTKGNSPGDPAGIENGVLAVPPNGLVELTLQGDHPDTWQISVHGGSDPFGLYSMGGGNGAATIQSAEVCPM